MSRISVVTPRGSSFTEGMGSKGPQVGGWDLGQNLSPGEETWAAGGNCALSHPDPLRPRRLATPHPAPTSCMSHSSAPALLLVLGFIASPLCSGPEAEATWSDSSLGLIHASPTDGGGVVFSVVMGQPPGQPAPCREEVLAFSLGHLLGKSGGQGSPTAPRP